MDPCVNNIILYDYQLHNTTLNNIVLNILLNHSALCVLSLYWTFVTVNYELLWSCVWWCTCTECGLQPYVSGSVWDEDESSCAWWRQIGMELEDRRGCLMKRVVCLCRHVNPHSLLKTGYELIWSDTRTRFPATSVANFSPLLTSQITWGSITNPSITSVTSATAVSILDYFISGLKSIAVLLIIYYPYVYLPRLHLFDQFSKKIYIYCEIL